MSDSHGPLDDERAWYSPREWKLVPRSTLDDSIEPEELGEAEAFALLGRLSSAIDITSDGFVSPHIKAALDGWGDGSHPFCGDFLRAVLSNDLLEAVGRADYYNIRTLPAIAAYVYNELPSPCHGTPTKVREWQTKCLAAIEAKRAAGVVPS